MFFYSDTKAPSGPIDLMRLARCDGTKKYLDHYANLLLLQVFMREGSTVEKIQAGKETTICERKLAYWKRHERYRHEEALAGMTELKKQWKGRAG